MLGLIGLGAALLSVAADLAMQYTPVAAHIGSRDYAYLLDVPATGLLVGLFLGVPALLAQIAGFRFVSNGLAAGSPRLARWFLGVSSVAFALGAAFHAMFVPIGLALQEIRGDGGDPRLLAAVAAAIRPAHQGLGAVVLLGIVVYSGLFLWAVATGRSSYPRWVALTSPLPFLIFAAILMRLAPALRPVLLPCALNLANAVFFGSCLLTLGPHESRAS